MNKWLLTLFLLAGLTSCSEKNKQYYQTHAHELQKAVRACPEKKPQGLSCQELRDLANHMNTMGYQLQLSPQGFGKKIIALQETIGKQQADLKNDESNEVLRTDLNRNQLELADHLAIIKWLESPAS